MANKAKPYEATILQREKELYIKECLAKKDLDPNKKWQWDNDGYI